MTRSDSGRFVRLDLNDEQFQNEVLNLEKHDWHSAFEALNKLGGMTSNQVYLDQGLKWEKIAGVAPSAGVRAIYSLRLTQSRRATAYHDGDFMCFLTVAPNHDATYGKN